MARADKLRAAMIANPRDWRIEDLKTLAARNGITARQPGTSHVTFRHASGSKLTVPARRPIKPVYVVKFIQWLDALQAGKEEAGDEG